MTLHQQQLTDTANALIEAADKIFLAANGEHHKYIQFAAVAINDHDDDSSADDIEYHANNAIEYIKEAKEADLRDDYLNTAYQAVLEAATKAIEELRKIAYNEMIANEDETTDND